MSYILFDDNYNQLQHGYHEISSNASFNIDSLYLDDITFNEAGYLYIYTSMQSDVSSPVYFDDMTVTHTHSPIVSKDDYYPFGLTGLKLTSNNGKLEYAKRKGFLGIKHAIVSRDANGKKIGSSKARRALKRQLTQRMWLMLF